ncbi:MAG: NUDIX hydrolase domain-like protein [Linnemannia gamsii]|nr:MAG: NUDIX hydrolase domain-like protein [Linnemannia gamsii]
MHQLNQKSVEALKNLHNYVCPPDTYQTNKRSAVLVALIPNDHGDLEVIITSRSSSLRTNAGDSAFPGGKRDPEDVDMIATAKREAMEEVSLPPSASQFITFFPPVLSRHMQVVTPVVAYCPTLTTTDLFKVLSPNPSEVSAIFTVPLEMFLSPRQEEYDFFDMSWLMVGEHRVHRFERCGTENFFITPPTSLTDQEEKEEGEGDSSQKSSSSSTTSHKFSYSNDGDDSAAAEVDRAKVGWHVYGMTAGILIEVACVAFQRAPDFQIYAPDQMTDQAVIADWYNQTQHTFRRSSL